MNKNKISLIIALALILYVTLSFYNASFNPKEFSEAGKGLTSILFIFTSIVVLANNRL